MLMNHMTGKSRTSSKMAQLLEDTAVYEWIVTVVTLGSQAAMVFGGIVPFMPQYRKIQRTNDAEGFSTFVCFVLTVANILRILFWFGKRFELPLLMQSIVMILTMMVMLQLCTETRRKQSSVVRRLWDFKREHFWNWSYFSDYCLFLLLFTSVMGIITMLFSRYPVYLESIGFMAVFTEAMLGIPQFVRNFRNQSTEGMSVIMVTCWFSGDTFKTVYFTVRSAPIQFAICGLIQIVTDIMIFAQVWYYRGRAKGPTASLPTAGKPSNKS